MKNEDLINILLEFPLEYEVEHCNPLIENGTIKFRAGCDQTNCTLTKEKDEQIKKTLSQIHVMKGGVTARGKAKDTPDNIRVFLRGLYKGFLMMEEILCKK